MLAPAKINLFLHVGGVQADGYHPVSSLVAFADIGDRLTVRPAERLSLSVTGPFAAGLDAGEDNLVLRAARAFAQAARVEPCVAITLDKRLPIASGLGGGSSDAGAALRAMRDLLAPLLSDSTLEAIGADLGADGAMCVRARTAWAAGRGERLTDASDFPALACVLANPGAPSSTRAVYQALDAQGPGDTVLPSPPHNRSVLAVIGWLAAQRNDLQGPAVALQSRIGQCLDIVAGAQGVRLARMSGSGATVFGLCETRDAADQAAERLARDHVGWWVRSCTLGA